MDINGLRQQILANARQAIPAMNQMTNDDAIKDHQLVTYCDGDKYFAAVISHNTIRIRGARKDTFEEALKDLLEYTMIILGGEAEKWKAPYNELPYEKLREKKNGRAVVVREKPPSALDDLNRTDTDDTSDSSDSDVGTDDTDTDGADDMSDPE